MKKSILILIGLILTSIIVSGLLVTQEANTLTNGLTSENITIDGSVTRYIELPLVSLNSTYIQVNGTVGNGNLNNFTGFATTYMTFDNTINDSYGRQFDITNSAKHPLYNITNKYAGASSLELNGTYGIVNTSVVNPVFGGSIGVWVYIKSSLVSSNTHYIFSTNSGSLLMRYTPSIRQVRWICDLSAVGATSINGILAADQLDTWTHIAATCDNTEATLYFDGELNVTAVPGGINPQLESSNVFHIGHAPPLPGTNFFNGSMDNLIVGLNKTWSSQEVNDLYNNITSLSEFSIRYFDETRYINNTSESGSLSDNSTKFHFYFNYTNCDCTDCSLTDQFCRIPIVFNTTAKGNFTIEALYVNYTFGLDNCSISDNYSINFTIVDEGNGTTISTDKNPIADAEFNFSADGINYYQISENIDNNNFSMCVYPGHANLIGDYEIQYSADDYPERRYTETSMTLTNTLQLINLNLLFAGDGIYARFQVVDEFDNILDSATVTMRKSGETDIIELEITDSSGLATFFVNPDQDYDFTFSKTGYRTQTFTLRPTTSEIYRVGLQSIGVTAPEPLSRGIEYYFFPVNTVLNNKTDYDFRFNLTSDYYNILECNFYIKNDTNTLGSVAGAYDTRSCNASIVYNTGSHEKLLTEAIVQFEFNTTNATRTFQDPYNIFWTYEGEFSLKNFLDDITTLGIAGFNDRTRMLIALVAIILITILVSRFAAIQNEIGYILLIGTLVWLFSFVGWLNVGMPAVGWPVVGSVAFAMNQYAIALLFTMGSIGYIIWRHQ